MVIVCYTYILRSTPPKSKGSLAYSPIALGGWGQNPPELREGGAKIPPSSEGGTKSPIALGCRCKIPHSSGRVGAKAGQKKYLQVYTKRPFDARYAREYNFFKV